MGLLARLTGRSAEQQEPAETPKPTARYRGVQVVADNGSCCQAAEAIAGQRYLSDEVPRLPLDHCDSEICACSYQLFDDRRTDPRRASDVGYDIASEVRTGENRRVEPAGRRNADY